MVELKLAFFEVQVESMFVRTAKACQTRFELSPEALSFDRAKSGEIDRRFVRALAAGRLQI
jgi:hypothetical protein